MEFLSLGNNLKGYAAYHSIDSLGTDIGSPWESADGGPWESHFESFRYASTSVGLGLTAGYELIKNNSQSLILQIDATLVHNTLEINLNPKGKYNTLSYHYNSYQNKFFTPYKHSENQIIPVVSGSLGWVFSSLRYRKETLCFLLILYTTLNLIQKQEKS